jgi:hypothetical protein
LGVIVPGETESFAVAWTCGEGEVGGRGGGERVAGHAGQAASQQLALTGGAVLVAPVALAISLAAVATRLAGDGFTGSSE